MFKFLFFGNKLVYPRNAIYGHFSLVIPPNKWHEGAPAEKDQRKDRTYRMVEIERRPRPLGWWVAS